MSGWALWQVALNFSFSETFDELLNFYACLVTNRATNEQMEWPASSSSTNFLSSCSKRAELNTLKVGSARLGSKKPDLFNAPAQLICMAQARLGCMAQLIYKRAEPKRYKEHYKTRLGSICASLVTDLKGRWLEPQPQPQKQNIFINKKTYSQLI